MGSRAIYSVFEKGEASYFYAHHGANALSPLMKVAQANAIQQTMSDKSISHILEHLDYNGEYASPSTDSADLFFDKLDILEANDMMKDFSSGSHIEMHITLDLDSNDCVLDYNKNCPWYAAMDTHAIPIDVGLNNVTKLVDYAEQNNVSSFGELLQIYHRATGLETELDYSRRMEQYRETHTQIENIEDNEMEV